MDRFQNSSPALARILIVDDHPNTATMLARVLSKLDTPVEVLTACSGEDALKIAGDGLIDVLITDFLMPGMNGLELIEKFKDGREPAHIILITAYDTPGLALSARRLKVQDYLVKPVQPERIRDIVARVLTEIHSSASPPGSIDLHKPVKILIADDYPDNIRLLASRLKSEGYSYISAEDGEQTLIKVRTENPDLVLLDVNMPNKDGFEVLAEMRADTKVAHIPVIVITAARIGPQDVREGLTLGADDYITKPFDWRELAARIRSKLRVKQAEDALRRRNQELGVLPEISQDIGARLDTDKLAETILKRTVETLGAKDAHLLVFNPDNSIYYRTYLNNQSSILSRSEIQKIVVSDGLISHISTTRQSVIINDTQNDERWFSAVDNGYHSAIAVPLLGSRDLLGILMLTHERPAYFNPDHLTILQAIASQAAIAVENSQLLNVERKRVQELVALNTLTREISYFSHSTELFERLPKMIHQVMAYPAVTIWMKENEQLNLKGIAGVENTVRRSLLEIAPQQAAETGQPAQLSGSIEERKGARAGIGNPPTQSAIAVPIFIQSNVCGVLAIHSQEAGIFQESDRVVLETLASQITSAYERIKLFESIEQQRKRLSAVLNGAADAILVIDATGCLQLVNPAGEKLFTDVEARVGKSLPVNKGYDDLIHVLDQVRQTGIPEGGEISWPDGRTFSVSLTPIEEGGQVAVLHDVSHFKALDQIKNEFIATATHDLKNPIFSVLGYSDLLKKAGNLNEMQLEFIGRIRNASIQMQDLVLNLLEIARMEMSPEMQTEAVNLHGLLTYVVGDFHNQAEARGHILSLQLTSQPFSLRGDKLRLEQVMRNLVSNAIKYTPDGGKITVKTECLDKKVYVSVADTGIGIPPESLPFIFDQFYRVQTPETQNIEGNGLGLAIVKSIIDKHGGQIKVESNYGQGSCFTFWLKANPE